MDETGCTKFINGEKKENDSFWSVKYDLEKKIKERVIWQIKCRSIIFVWSYCTSRHGFPFGLMNKNLCGGLPTYNYLPDPWQCLAVSSLGNEKEKRRGEEEKQMKWSSFTEGTFGLCSVSGGRKFWVEDGEWAGGMRGPERLLRFLRKWCGVKSLLRKWSRKKHRHWQTVICLGVLR